MALGLVCRRYKEFIQKSRNAMMMHLNTRSRTFLVDRALCKISRMRVISSPQARAAAEEVLSRIIMPILNRPSYSVLLTLVRCSKTDQLTSSELQPML